MKQNCFYLNYEGLKLHPNESILATKRRFYLNYEGLKLQKNLKKVLT